VTATDQNDAIYANASQGDYIPLAAPGVGILAPVPKGGYEISSGTSFAAANITGLVALMLSQKDSLTTSDVRTIIEASSTDLASPGRDAVLGAGS